MSRTAGPLAMARSWHTCAQIIDGTRSGDVTLAERQMQMIATRCPDVALRCPSCGHLTRDGGRGHRCTQRAERLAS